MNFQSVSLQYMQFDYRLYPKESRSLILKFSLKKEADHLSFDSDLVPFKTKFCAPPPLNMPIILTEYFWQFSTKIVSYLVISQKKIKITLTFDYKWRKFIL